MISTLQITILLQGIFLVFVLLKNQKRYKTTQFWLLVCCIIAIVLYSIGDDDNHLFITNANWFLFDNSLFVTFLFLFVLYYNSGKKYFLKKHYLFFVPNLIYFSIEIFEITTQKEPLYIEILEFFVKLIFLSYLICAIYVSLKKNSKYWLLYFIVAITILLSIEFLDDIISYFHLSEVLITESQINLCLLLLVALLFYFMTFYLMQSSDSLLTKKEITKYKNTNLSDACVKKCKSGLITIMEKDKLYLNRSININMVSKELHIPKQYISEVLNIHMKTNFQDFVNSYRVDAFINCLENEEFSNYSLLGIANEVGFNSKSSFNATFKKIKGLTPSQFQKSLSSITK